MVILIRSLWLFTFLYMSSLSGLGAVYLSAEVDAVHIKENQRLDVTVISAHPRGYDVDKESFEMENKPLKVELVSEDAPSEDQLVRYPDLDSNSLVSVYRFQIDGKPKGLYILPSISVKVGTEVYSSVPTTYNVSATQASGALTLEALVDGPQPMYPGQRAKLKYRVFFSKDIELVEENLPLLEPKGLQKIGDKVVSDYQADPYTVQEISQEIRAIEPGIYPFGPSKVSGYVYSEDSGGRRVYQQPLIHAEASPVTIDVVPFPVDGKPPSFNGAIGQYTLKVVMSTPEQVSVGDKITLSIRLSGTGGPDTIKVPDLACQPGFSGFFDLGDTAPREEGDKVTTTFIVDLRPLSDDVKAVPPIEFSYFDPFDKVYQTLRSDKIPLQVLPAAASSQNERTETWLPMSYKPRQVDFKTLVADASLKTSVQAKEQALNRALRLYTEAQALGESSQLDYNLGDTYYQLHDNGRALLYLYRANRLSPRDTRVREALTIISAQQGLEAPALSFFVLTVRERLLLLGTLLVVAIFLIALTTVWPTAIRIKAASIATICTVLVFTSLLYTWYLAPVEAVVLRSYVLRTTANEDSSKGTLLPAGTKVEIAPAQDPFWFKVTTPSGEVGYIPRDIVSAL